MPRLPRGLTKRRFRTTRGVTHVFVWRRIVNGKEHRVSLGSDYAIALARYGELERGSPVESVNDSLTLEGFSKRWLAEYAATKRTPRGRSQAEQRFRDYLWPNLGESRLAGLKPADLRRLNAALEARQVGLVTRRRLLEDVRCMLRYAVEEAEVLERSPWRRGILLRCRRLLHGRSTNSSWLMSSESRRIRWKPVLLLLARTGLRWGEVRAIRWEDVRESPYPHLVVSRSHSGPTKSRKVREVPLLPEAQEVLGGLSRSGARVFAWLPETASWIRRYVHRCSWVKDFHVHRLRHTFALHWLERGGTKETLQEVLGHSTVKLTETLRETSPVGGGC